MPLAGFHCIKKSRTVYLWLMNIGLYIESTCFFNFRVGNKFSYLGHPAIGKNNQKTAVFRFILKSCVHFFLPGSTLTNFSSQITVSFSKLFNKIALKSFLFISGLSNRFSGFFFLDKILPFHQQFYTHW